MYCYTEKNTNTLNRDWKILKNYIDEVRQLSQVFCVYWYYLKGYYRITDKDLY